MDFSPASDVNHHLASHAHPYNTPQSAASGASFSSPFRQQSGSAEAGASRGIHAGGNNNHMLSADGSPGLNNQAYYGGDGGRNIHPPSSTTPPTAPARYSNQPQSSPTDRSLPAREVTDEETFENAYVAFILYCNPSFPLNIDANDLRRNFNSPPRSDGKNFSTLVLFELLKKLESKDIKTWTELALELGVEKPVMEKGQSSQKVQQYSVRLKVWFEFISEVECFCCISANYDFTAEMTLNFHICTSDSDISMRASSVFFFFHSKKDNS
jgi:ARS binding protein 2